MATDYEKVYRQQRHALGEPAREIVAFFEQFNAPVRVLDLGCGQGRDALFIARLGHTVEGVDLSASGVHQLVEDANREGLSIKGIVADVVDYEPDGIFDVVIIDRTLHMMRPSDRESVLNCIANHISSGGFVLICDERKNLPAIEHLFLSELSGWQIEQSHKGFLFLQKT